MITARSFWSGAPNTDLVRSTTDLEVLAGYLVAYLNLDEVIRIIREEDDAKAELIRTFELTDVQAEAILNMRLRSLRKLEELEIRKEHDKLTEEKDQLTKLIGSDARQWTRISKEITEISKVYGLETEIGKRRNRQGRSSRSRPRGHPASDDRKGTDHGHHFRKRLDPGTQGASVRSDEPVVQTGRQAQGVLPRGNDGQDPDFFNRRKFFTLGADRLPGDAVMANRSG